MTWALISGLDIVAVGTREQVLSEGVERGVVSCAAYEATRTGDEVVRYRLIGAAKMIPAVWLDPELKAAA